MLHVTESSYYRPFICEAVRTIATPTTEVMASEPAFVTDGGKEGNTTAGYDASLSAVIGGPWSNSLAVEYCHDIGAYCDVDNCKTLLAPCALPLGC